MSQIAWFHGDKLLRVDNLPREWCPWHVHFFCPICGEVWARRLFLSESAVHTYRGHKCPFCTTHSEFFGLQTEILNHNETSANYLPTEILCLEFLSATTELPNV